MRQVEIFDTTLRDGAQSEKISFTLADKLNIVKILDGLGVAYIEAGNPFSNKKDKIFFESLGSIKLDSAKLAAFGSTRRPNIEAEQDANCAALILAATKTTAIFGKCWDFHVTDIIHTSLEENLNMIYDTVFFLCQNKREVIFDAEHFFDGYFHNEKYALKALEAAQKAGATTLVLCDTNGGTLPDEIGRITHEICKSFDAKIGIHCHNDLGCAVAASIAAVQAGAQHVQGTFLGIGERCGNTNLSALIPTLQLKLGYSCIPDSMLPSFTKSSRLLAELSNSVLPDNLPYVGKSAFAHKGGMHIDGVIKNPKSFEHIDPEAIGNSRNLLISEISGRTALIQKLGQFTQNLTKDSVQLNLLMEKLKELEYKGYQFESATASFEMLTLRQLGKYQPFFRHEYYKIIGEQIQGTQTYNSTAVIKVFVGDKSSISAAEGEGPVNALDKALRGALAPFYPSLSDVRLVDYKVRVLDPKEATASKVRVLIESSDKSESWTTIGVSFDIIKASWRALIDSIEYKLYKDLVE